mmetsp:Transcript_13341/g.20840  ORF Transcript_13341/g.20840 Transcript_13341/m.20840 type:complete len:122 (+) Transcript_13341:2372-2737(+)
MKIESGGDLAPAAERLETKLRQGLSPPGQDAKDNKEQIIESKEEEKINEGPGGTELAISPEVNERSHPSLARSIEVIKEVTLVKAYYEELHRESCLLTLEKKVELEAKPEEEEKGAGELEK